MSNIWAKTASTLADIAAPIAKNYFRQSVAQNLKPDGTAVSEADLAIELAVRNYLEIHFPEHGILGEEYGSNNELAEYTWVVDPIDGTASFLCGKPTFCTLIALLHHGEPILGLISQPILEERWLGIKGERTLFNDKPIPPLTEMDSNILRFSCTTPTMFHTEEEQRLYQTISQKATVKSYGGDAYAYGLLALGMIDLILEANLAYYDIAALIPIIEGVGGRLTDWQGQAIRIGSFKGQVLAVNQNHIDYGTAKLILPASSSASTF